MAYPTNPIYKLIKNPYTNVVDCVQTQEGNTQPCKQLVIPFAEDNTHYQEYLKWVAEGNTAEAAD